MNIRWYRSEPGELNAQLITHLTLAAAPRDILLTSVRKCWVKLLPAVRTGAASGLSTERWRCWAVEMLSSTGPNCTALVTEEVQRQNKPTHCVSFHLLWMLLLHWVLPQPLYSAECSGLSSAPGPPQTHLVINYFTWWYISVNLRKKPCASKHFGVLFHTIRQQIIHHY